MCMIVSWIIIEYRNNWLLVELNHCSLREVRTWSVTDGQTGRLNADAEQGGRTGTLVWTWAADQSGCPVRLTRTATACCMI